MTLPLPVTPSVTHDLDKLDTPLGYRTLFHMFTSNVVLVGVESSSKRIMLLSDDKDSVCDTIYLICSFLTWFGHDFPAGQVVSVRSFLIAATTRHSGLSLVARFACTVTLANLQRFEFEFHLRSSSSALAGEWISVDQLIIS